MNYIFSTAGRAALRAVVSQSTLYAFDLDGTLAPIVDDPAGITIPNKVLNSLIQLDHLAPVAIITGRSRADALSHLGFTPRCLVGNHGAEGLPGHEGQDCGFHNQAVSWEQQLTDLLSPEIRSSVLIENKGESLSLHYRHAAGPDEVHSALLAAIVRLVPPPRRVGGKFVENLIPHGAPHKGDALLYIMKHLGCRRALFVGDDETDEDVFRLADESVFGIRIGKDCGSAAVNYLQSQSEIVPLLDEIMAILSQTGSVPGPRP